MSEKDDIAILPRYRFPEFSESWKTIKLIDIADYRRGSFPQPYGLPKWYDELNGMPFIQVFDVDDNMCLKASTKNKISKLASKQSVFIEKGTLIVTLQGSIGRVAITQYDAYIDRTLLLFEKFYRDIDKVFLAHSIQQLFEIKKQSAPGGIIKTITKQVLSEFTVQLPEKLEQQKIADCLSSIAELISAEEKKLLLLNNYKKGWIQKLFPAEGKNVPEWRFPEFKDSEGWETIKLRELADYRRGSFPQPYGLSKWYDELNGMPFIQVFDVDENMCLKATTKNKISELASQQSVFIEKGTLIVTLQGSIGRVAITQYDAYIDRTLLLFEKFYRDVDKVFLVHTIQQLFEIKKQSAPGGIIKTITKQVLSEFTVQLPEKPEQQKIANFLSGIDDLISKQTSKIESLKCHKKALMQGLFPTVGEAWK
ncbi:hypothetical protein HMPREF9194_02273 [Treponema maltophilum ATCC 51939]|uniref:Type I restriction modification DNA specificity domain-containing protein n=1 Tax=Treponema maltophilum ATCC 51939 TaxID=1125699 RepID=S3K0Y0_TREMA|nr:restriction endonuclease subunit S [Treponema maltophilum]EPF31918.1 hypothetical protein HMPREF9194_02273 [Treponema maltophilum ATCC 51939]